MEGSGYIKLYRKFLEWEWYDDDNCTRLFIHCLLKANYMDKQWRGKTILRGQFFTSIDTLSKELHLTTKQIRIAISKLENTGEILKKGANEGTYITICNYDSYQQIEQAEGQTEGKRGASEGQTKGKRGATTKKDKKEKNIEEGKEYIPAFILWLQYKKERKQSYKSELSTTEAYSHLLALSGNNPDTAMLIVKQSIANNWAGLFALKTDGKQRKPAEITSQELYELSLKNGNG